MSNEISPYDELVEKVNKLEEFIIKQVQFNSELLDIIKNDGEMIKKLMSQIKKIERKTSPENPGDINTLYQNWDKH